MPSGKYHVKFETLVPEKIKNDKMKIFWKLKTEYRLTNGISEQRNVGDMIEHEGICLGTLEPK